MQMYFIRCLHIVNTQIHVDLCTNISFILQGDSFFVYLNSFYLLQIRNITVIIIVKI